MARRPDIDQAVERIGKYASREPWLTHRRDHIVRMLGSLPERYQLTPSEISAEIVELGFAATLFGFVDEAFLAAEFGPDRVNVIDDYLKRRGWQESPRAREYLQGIRSCPVSLYEVNAVAPGEWLELRDRFREGPPQRIGEVSGSRSLQRWDLIVARVVSPRGEPMLTGGVLALTREAGDALLGILQRVRDKGRRSVSAMARKLGVDDDFVTYIDETTLRIGDRIFLQLWLKSLLDLGRRPPPELRNTDGEGLLLSRTRLPIVATREDKVARRLDVLAEWAREQDDEPAWVWRSGPEGEMQTIRGSARIDNGVLVLEANSRERMERALATLRDALGTLVGDALTSHEDPACLLRHGAPHGTQAPSGEPAPEGSAIDAAIRQFKDAHYRRTLDEPVPALGNRTPRACARSKQGRARLIRWLKDLENGELQQAAADGKTPYDVGWMWQELGVGRD